MNQFVANGCFLIINSMKTNSIRAFCLSMLIFTLLVGCNPAKKQASAYIHNEGMAQGTYYSATYLQPDGRDLKADLDSFFVHFDNSLSTYKPTSVISRINSNQSDSVDACFIRMFEAAERISAATGGAFDITVAPLVNAWGFGFKTGNTDNVNVKGLLPLIGFHKVKIENNRLIKENKDIMLDASAIAQGLSADMIAELFEKNGCENYMIDIGGEIVCKGKNLKGKNWQIGVDKPVDDPNNEGTELQVILNISNKGLTTSGNYRKFYYKNGKKYAHTIDPKTGYPVIHDLLSATVIAGNCTDADAYATAFMVMGREKAMKLCMQTPGLECYLIYTDKDGKFKVEHTPGFEKYIVEK